jgi:hypothetical protein
MKKNKVALTALTVIAAGFASAQTPILAPFAPTIGETFNSIPLGSSPSFVGYSGAGALSRLSLTGLLLVTNVIVPPISGNAMFGRGTNVRIRYQQVWKQWGGHFRVPNAGIAVTAMGVRFYRAGVPIGVSVFAPINNTSWQWRGWDLGSLGGYDEVRIYGNVAASPGYVGMENLRSR